MRTTRCPFCAGLLTEVRRGNDAAIHCTECRAAWQIHNHVVRRVAEPRTETTNDTVVDLEAPDESRVVLLPDRSDRPEQVSVRHFGAARRR